MKIKEHLEKRIKGLSDELYEYIGEPDSETERIYDEK